jgi:ATP-binding cassette subfamily F protein 3
MLLRPSNTLLLDEPTNHLDLDSKDVLLEALEDYGGTLIFVSHDRYFIDRLATKTVEVGGGEGILHLGTYEELLWRKAQQAAGSTGGNQGTPTLRQAQGRPEPGRGTSRVEGRKSESPRVRESESPKGGPRVAPGTATAGAPAAGNGNGARRATPEDREERKRAANEAKRLERERQKLQNRIAELESRIADREQAIKELETSMAAPGFYDDRDSANAVISRHQALMWEVGDLMQQWEHLQTQAEA